jgi:hypothetical protein
MKRFGLKIGSIGVEFPSREEREKALTAFVKGTDVEIFETGVKYRDGKGSFSVYERMTEETLVTCADCDGVIGIDSCPRGNFPHKDSWNGNYTTRERHLCDACSTFTQKAKKIFEAEQLIKNSKTND